MTSNARNGRGRQMGYTLIELLVVMAISSVMLGAIYTAFAHQKRSYMVEDLTARSQQNLRIGMMMVSREIRAAGAGLARNGVNAPSSMLPAAGNLLGLRIVDNNPDEIHIIYANASCSAPLTTAIPVPTGLAQIDVQDVSCFSVGDMLVVTTPNSFGSVFQASGIPSATRIDLTYGGTPPASLWNDMATRVFPTTAENPPAGGYEVGAMVLRARMVAFQVDGTTNMLQMDADGVGTGSTWVDIAEDITTFDVNFIFQDGSTATAYDSIAATATTADDYNNIRSVQITMTARTNRPMPNSINATFPAGQFRTRTLQETVRVRNFGMRLQP